MENPESGWHFTTDSGEYDILKRAAESINGVPGAVIELGTRRGGSAQIMMDALADNGDAGRLFCCVDPYGNIPYQAQEQFEPGPYGYNNDMRNEVIPRLYAYAYSRGFDFRFFNMEDVEFYRRYADGVPVYDDNKILVNQYALTFVDAQHTNKSVYRAMDFFVSRIPRGGVIVWDDIKWYDHNELEEDLYDNGFELIEKGDFKASYVKIST